MSETYAIKTDTIGTVINEDLRIGTYHVTLQELDKRIEKLKGRIVQAKIDNDNRKLTIKHYKDIRKELVKLGLVEDTGLLGVR